MPLQIVVVVDIKTDVESCDLLLTVKKCIVIIALKYTWYGVGMEEIADINKKLKLNTHTKSDGSGKTGYDDLEESC